MAIRNHAFQPRSRKRALVVLLLCTTALAACQTPTRPAPNPHSARSRLGPLLESWERAKRQDGGCEQRRPQETPHVDCDKISLAIERLAVEFPRDADVLLAAAAATFDRHKNEDALKTLDVLRSIQPIHPDAAVLRARIAIDEGNLRFAHRLLEEQRELTPDHSGLWELLAAVAYLEEEYAQADRGLDIAARLGAPPWRIAYHRGLVAESTLRLKQAEAEYATCLRAEPDFAPARSRLRALAVRNPGRATGAPLIR
ncbi:MAG: tetratricopeptide repeat protein [Myxococcota bacterium]